MITVESLIADAASTADFTWQVHTYSTVDALQHSAFMQIILTGSRAPLYLAMCLTPALSALVWTNTVCIKHKQELERSPQ